MCNAYINSLGKDLALNLFVYNNAHLMLGDVLDSSRFVMGMPGGHSFLRCAHSLSVYSITFLVDLQDWAKEQLHVLKALETNEWVPLLFSSVLVILVKS